MRISASEAGSYRDRIASIQEQARVYVESSILTFAALNPGASVADFREYGRQVLEQAMRVYGDQASVAACQRYDETARRLGLDLDPALISNEIDGEGVDRDARYLAGLIVPERLDI